MSQALFSVLVILVTSILARCFRRCGASFFEPVPIFLYGILFSASLLLTHLIVILPVEHQFPFTWFSFIIIVVGLFVFALGGLAGIASSRIGSTKRLATHCESGISRPPGASNANHPGLGDFSIVFVLGIFAAYYIVTNLVNMANFVSFDFLDLLAEYRQRDLEARQGNTIEGGSILMSLSRSAAVVIVVLLFLGFQVHIRRISRLLFVALSICGIATLVFEDLISGARFGLLFVCLLFVFSRITTSSDRVSTRNGLALRYTTAPFRSFHLFIGFTVITFALVFMPYLRNPDLAESLNIYLSFAHSARLSEFLTTGSDTGITGVIASITYGVRYFILALPKLAFTIDFVVPDFPLASGVLNGKLLLKFTSIIDPTLNSTWFEVRENYASVMGQFGFNPNPWKTIIGDVLLDFGFYGYLPALFAFGFFLQFFYRVSLSINDMTAKVISIVLMSMGFCSAFFGVLVINLFVYTLALLMVLQISVVGLRIVQHRY